ncbi:MAG: hypothetical protein R3B90_22050 [Planctomycetaceae bacterium]
MTIVWCLPLALFTFLFGSVNLEQSFGNLGDIYVAEHKVGDRWSIAGWTYYLREIGRQLSPLLWGLGLAGAAVVAWRPTCVADRACGSGTPSAGICCSHCSTTSNPGSRSLWCRES